MKNAIEMTFGTINLVVEGQPIVLENIHMSYSNEASVQEMAAGASFVKDLVREVKDMIKEAQASAQSYQPCTSTPATPATPATTSKPAAEAKPQTEQRWDLPAVWSCMMAKLPTGFKKTGVGHYTYETGSLKEKNRIRVILEFKTDSIDVDITIGDATAFCHLCEDGDNSYMTGINAALVGEIIDALPEDIKAYISEYLKKITK